MAATLGVDHRLVVVNRARGHTGRRSSLWTNTSNPGVYYLLKHVSLLRAANSRFESRFPTVTRTVRRRFARILNWVQNARSGSCCQEAIPFTIHPIIGKRLRPTFC